MKKLIAILLSALCVLTFAGCDLTGETEVPGKGASQTEGGTTESGSQKPPALTVRLGDASLQASVGNYNWTHDNGDGTASAVNACGSSILACKEDLPSLTLNPTGERNIVKLEFASAPDTFNVNCWSYNEESLYDIAFVRFADEKQEDNVCYLSLDRDFVVEVYAEWNSSETGSGSVYYGFCTRTPD